MTPISRNFRSNIVVGSLVVILPIILTYFLYWAPAVEGSNTNPTIQTSTYENSNLGIRLEHPTDWKSFERTSAATNASVVEFVPIVRSEHDPLAPFFSISVEDLNDTDLSKKGKDNSLSETNTNDSRLNALTERNLGLAESLPDFGIVETNRTFILSDNPAYKIVYTFADPGSPLHDEFETMNIWTVRENKAYTFSYTADKSVFLNHLPTIQNMVDSFVVSNGGN